MFGRAYSKLLCDGSHTGSSAWAELATPHNLPFSRESPETGWASKNTHKDEGCWCSIEWGVRSPLLFVFAQKTPSSQRSCDRLKLPALCARRCIRAVRLLRRSC